MGKKQKASHDSRIQTPSIPDLADGITMARMRCNRRELKHRRRKLKDGPLINAIVAWFLTRSHEEQASIAEEGLKRFEAMLDGEESIPIDCEVIRRQSGISLRPGIDKVDTKGKNPTAKAHRGPKRGA